MSTSVLARRKSCRIGTASCAAKLGGICTRRVRCTGAPSLRMSSSAYSSLSKDLATAGSRCCPALVRVSACGLRSNSGTPVSRSSAITWRESALWEMSSALAAAVKLPCFATPSKARNALRGSQRRSIAFLSMTLMVAENRLVRHQWSKVGERRVYPGAQVPGIRALDHQPHLPRAYAEREHRYIRKTPAPGTLERQRHRDAPEPVEELAHASAMQPQHLHSAGEVYEVAPRNVRKALPELPQWCIRLTQQQRLRRPQPGEDHFGATLQRRQRRGEWRAHEVRRGGRKRPAGLEVAQRRSMQGSHHRDRDTRRV